SGTILQLGHPNLQHSEINGKSRQYERPGQKMRSSPHLHVIHRTTSGKDNAFPRLWSRRLRLYLLVPSLSHEFPDRSMPSDDLIRYFPLSMHDTHDMRDTIAAPNQPSPDAVQRGRKAQP